MANKKGFFAVDRNIERWKWYTDANTFRVWMHILIKCNYLPGESYGITIKPGQWLTSYQHIATDLKITKSQTRTSIEHLKMTREIACEIAGYGLLITVINWDKYNSKENKSHGMSHGTSSENRTVCRTVNRTNITKNKQSNKETIKDLEDDDIEIDDAISVYRRRAQQAYQGTGDINLAYDKLEQIAADIPSDRRKFIIPNLDRVTKLIDQFWIEGDIGDIKNPEGYIWSILSSKPRKQRKKK